MMKPIESKAAEEKQPLGRLLRRAEAGDTAAQGALGRKYHFGIGVGKNREEALRWGQLAAQGGNACGQALMGCYCLDGIILAKDYEQSRRWYQLSARQGFLPAIHSLGLISNYGYGVEKDPKQAKRWYTRAARKGYAFSQLALGWIYEEEGLWRQSFYWYHRAAKQGLPFAQSKIACSYHLGEGVSRNDALALHWALLAAKGGSAWGQRLLGNFYRNGVGHPQDYGLSRRWLKRAACQGDAEAMFWLGEFYREGLGLGKNRSRAKSWFLRSAEKGYSEAQLVLAFLLEKNPGDYEQAHGWYLRAAEQGNDCAQFFLFDHYMTGNLTGEVNVEKACYWLELAAAAGYQSAIEKLAEMDAFLFTSEDFNNDVGLPSWLRLPMRRRSYWLMYTSGMPSYEALLADLRRYIAVNPVDGYEFLEDVSLLEELAAGPALAPESWELMDEARRDRHVKSRDRQ